MAALNIRNVDPGLVKNVKKRALDEDKTMREVVIELLEEYAANSKGKSK